MARKTRGRSVAELVEGDGAFQMPRPEPKAAPPRDGRMFRAAPPRGPRRSGAGWSATSAPIMQYRMTTDQAPALWPFIHSPALPPRGAKIGIDEHSQGVFHVDPAGWVLDDSIPVTNPNIFVFGKPGQGKSAVVKAMLLRMSAFGYRTLILGDVKDEYEPFCRVFGQEPLAVGPGLSARINPLDFGPLRHGWERLSAEESQKRSAILFNRWLTLVRGLVGSQRVGDSYVPFGPSEERAVKIALRELTGQARGTTLLREVTLPQLWAALDNPTDTLIKECRYRDARHFLDETRLLRDALGHLTTGALSGIFDDHTNIDVDWSAPIASLSLSRLSGLGDEAVGIGLTCLNSWGTGMRELAAPGDIRAVVRDECWRQLRLGPDAVKSFDGSLRTSRSDGDIQIAVAHKPSDLASAGDEGSQAAKIAKDMLHLADIKVLFGQDDEIARELEHILGLGALARSWVTGWAMQGKGRALWCLGDRIYKVQSLLHPLELGMSNTNQAIEKAGA